MIPRHDRLYIDGCWTPSAGSATIAVLDPAREEELGRVPAGDAADVERAVSAAAAALPAWAQTPVAERAAALQRIRDGLKAREEELAVLISREVGTPLKMSRRIQAALPVAVLDSFIALAGTFPWQEELGNSTIYREAKGVAACITPWNYPLHQIVGKLAPALLAGCTVVLKPSEVAPLNAFLLAEVCAAAGLAPGVFNLLSGSGATVGEALVSHPAIDLVSFTGSTAAGRRVAALAGEGIKRVALELGGKSASLVLADADLAAAVKGTVNSCYLNAGQTCSALTRLLVPAERLPEAAALAVEVAATFVPGDPLDEQTRLGPLVSAAQRERVRELIASGLAQGAELLTGGAEPPAGCPRGYYVAPTVFAKVTPAMRIAREEIFGPVLTILPYGSEEEGLAMANDSPYGLAGAVWSADPQRARAFARRLRAGQVDLNGARFNLLAPFGGCKQSGIGREFGHFGLEEFTELKAVQS